MTMTETRNTFDDDMEDLDALCAFVTMQETIARALGVTRKIAWEADWADYDPVDEDIQWCLDDAEVALKALWSAGLVKPEWYGYDEDTKQTTTVV